MCGGAVFFYASCKGRQYAVSRLHTGKQALLAGRMAAPAAWRNSSRQGPCGEARRLQCANQEVSGAHPSHAMVSDLVPTNAFSYDCNWQPGRVYFAGVDIAWGTVRFPVAPFSSSKPSHDRGLDLEAAQSIGAV